MKPKEKKIQVKPSSFPLVHLLGSDEEKAVMYQDYRCPVDLLNEAFNEWQDNSTDRGIKFKTALAENPSLTSEQVFFLGQDPNYNVSNLALQNINHPTFQRKISEDFHRSCLMPLSHVFKKDPHIMESIKKCAFLTGGSLGSLIRRATTNPRNNPRRNYNSRENIKDWDFYFTDENELLKVINHFLLNISEINPNDKNYTPIPENLQLIKTDYGFDLPQLKGKGVIWADYKPNLKHQIILSHNALTIKNPGFTDFQLIFKVCKPTPEEVVQTFDFAHCQGILLPTGILKIEPKTYASLIDKKIFFQGGLNPINSIIRLFKLTAKKEWYVDRVELLKMMAYAAQKIDFTSPKDIKEHLQGFYFETTYPELFKYPEDKKITLVELFEWLDGNI